nr:PREDICTED: protein spire homolog 1-like [Latimeria chalumnae]|eukprot:XP_014340816.1 PREDICTED: protein spire homolog 1-like [Latimeria chalumnae]
MEQSSCKTIDQYFLKDILRSCGQSVSEEQAWALCYQCCCKIQQQMEQALVLCQKWNVPILQGAENIIIHRDGTVSFTYYQYMGKDFKKTSIQFLAVVSLTRRAELEELYFTCKNTLLNNGEICSAINLQTEKQVVECLGALIYKALDWGLNSDVERNLSEPLEKMIRQMTKLDYDPLKQVNDLWHGLTFEDTIKVCEDRLLTRSQANGHYKAVCRALFKETIELHEILHSIQKSRENLRLLERDVLTETTSLTEVNSYLERTKACFLDVINELQAGVKLRNAKERQYNGLPVKYELAPYEILMDDIRYRRYTLNKVEVSEKKLEECSHEEPTLHEMLMTEIKSARKLHPKTMQKMRGGYQGGLETSSTYSSDCDSLYAETLKDDAELKICTGQLTSPKRPDFDSEGENSWGSECSSLDAISDNRIEDFTSNSTGLSKATSAQKCFWNTKISFCIFIEHSVASVFVPVLTSSQNDFKTNSTQKLWQSSHRRTKSLENAFKLQEYESHCSDCVSPSIAELVHIRQAILRAEFQQDKEYGSFRRGRVSLFSIDGKLKVLCSRSTNDFFFFFCPIQLCSSCHRKRLFFTWPHTCYFCKRVMCPDCCTEMSLPFQQCIHLPVSFLKTLILTKESSQVEKTKKFWQETQQWDCSRVPLVLESHDLIEIVYIRETMRDWPTVDICIKCEEFLLGVIKSCQQPTSKYGSRRKSESSHK